MNRKKHALVTGGSRGIGSAIIHELLDLDYEVWYLSRTKNEASDNGDLHHVPCDIADRKEVERALKAIIDEAREIDLLVNNAGITRDGLIMRMKDEAWDDVLAVNLSSVFLTSRAVSRIMARQRSGAIVNISSVVGIMGNGGQTNYAASKAGIIGFSKALARELASRNVRVNVVAPGFIDTSMTETLADEARGLIKAQIPLGRMGMAREVAKAVAFLASEDASYITGAVLSVDGGMAM
ncbi:MAG: 3-oxoacyl-[acyl-carrier-protein] reductase [Spirochaetales bacterium]|nr:3-oxoacyl-[acyl-carrier-protein] reductase [Spirochaetales bacterium]